MKKIIKTVPILLVAAIVMSLFSVLPAAGADGTTVSVWNGDTSKTLADLKGTGTRTDPYLISDGAELYAAVVGSHNASEIKYFSITNDIYLNSVENDEYKNWDNTAPANKWTESEIHFTGILEGNGYTVYGLYVKKDGLCGFVDQLNGPSSIKNLNIRKSCVIGTSYTGVFAGYMTNGGAVISGCTAADVKVTSKNNAAGGIVGRMGNKAAVTDSACYNTSFSSNEGKGGIAGNGWNGPMYISNCFSVGYMPVGKSDNAGKFFTYSNVYSDKASVSGVTVLDSSKMQGSDAVKTMKLSDITWSATDTYPIIKGYFNGVKGEVWSGKRASTYAGGDGTFTNPYLIETGEQLYAAVLECNNATEMKYFSITSDIYLNSVEENEKYGSWNEENHPKNTWIDDTVNFTGAIDGNGYTVYGLYVNKNGHSGFVDQLNGPSSIKNLNIRKSCIVGSGYTGVFAGYMTNGGAVISGCTAAEVKVTSTGGAAGGIVGRMGNKATVTDSACYNASFSSNEGMGGIAGNGWNGPMYISNCFSADYVPVGNSNNAVQFTYSNVYSDKASVSGVTVLDNSKMQGSDAVKTMQLSDITWSATDTYPIINVHCNGVKGEVWSGKNASTFAGGDGTAENPYLIETGEQLRKAICDLGQTNGAPTYYLITEDIYLNDITKVADWAIAAPANNWYSDSLNREWIGNIDGGGHTVYGLYSSTVDANELYNQSASLIQRFAGGATVKNLHIRNSYLYAPNVCASAFFGIATGNNGTDAVLSGCSADAGVSIKAKVAGGLFAVPRTNIKVENSWFAATGNTLVGSEYRGGLYGNRWGTQTIDVKNTYFDGCPPHHANRIDGNVTLNLDNVYQINPGDQNDGRFTFVQNYREMSGLDTSEWYWIEDGRPLLKNRGEVIYDIDADDDEALDAGDLAALRKNLLSVSGYENIISDVNGDEKTDIIDLIVLKKAVLNFEKKNLTDNYRIVWRDEFNGSSLDSGNWSFTDYMSAYSDMATGTGSDVAKVTTDGSNGILRLRAYKTDDGAYKTVKSVTTGERMTFLYGYLEMRAKVPVGKGVWPSFWLKSNTTAGGEELAKKLGYNKSFDYNTEVDVFENFGADSVIPNLHKWWKEGTQVYKDYNSKGQTARDRYSSFRNYSISDGGWHTYGMRWTPERISFYIDGTMYASYDLSINFGNGDMNGFSQPLCIILNNHLFTPEFEKGNSWAKDYTLNPDEFTESVYDIDYVRLYQKPSEGKIYSAK